jgi:uncharacterized protein with HEPN domain
MHFKNPGQRLRDIIENIDAIQAFAAGMTLADFVLDRKTVYAVTRALEIISEASRRLPDELKSRHPGIDWPAVAAAGNLYRHEYEVIDDAVVWHTVQHDLAELRDLSEAELDRLRRTESAGP